MLRGRLLGGLAALGGAAILAAPAGAATPGQIYRDIAADGALTGHYSKADLQSALKSASVQGYGNPLVVVTLKPVIAAKPTEGLLGAQQTKTGRPLAAAARSQGTLPFTGAQLTVFAVIGALLLASGLLLRRTARDRSKT
jgi:hypothetical protein